MAATLRTIAASSLQTPVQKLATSFHGKEVVCSVKLPCMHTVYRLAVEARQGESERRPFQNAAAQAVRSVVGENGSRHLQTMSVVAMNVLLASPALAEEMEKGKIFDFNLTLPIIAVQFLLLMVALDKIWFKPVGDFMDSRDEDIRKKLVGTRDNSAEIKSLQSEAEGLIKAARAETSAALAKMKKETAAELDAKLQASRERVEKELAEAIKKLEEQKNDTLGNLDAQVSTLSEEIIRKVVPFKV